MNLTSVTLLHLAIRKSGNPFARDALKKAEDEKRIQKEKAVKAPKKVSFSLYAQSFESLIRSHSIYFIRTMMMTTQSSMLKR